MLTILIEKAASTIPNNPANLSGGAIAGIVIAVVVVVTAIILAVVLTLPQTVSSASSSVSASSIAFSSIVASSSTTASSSGSSSTSGPASSSIVASSSPASSSLVASSSVALTTTQTILSTQLTGQPGYPGSPSIYGPFSTFLVSSPIANLFFVMNNDGATFTSIISGTTYGGGNALTTTSTGNSSSNTVTAAVVGLALNNDFGSLPVDDSIPIITTTTITPGAAGSPTVNLPITLTGSITDYVCFCSNGNTSSNPSLVSASNMNTLLAVQLFYYNSNLASLRFDVFVARVNTTGISSGSVLYAENANVLTPSSPISVTYTLAANVTSSSGSIQWFAQSRTLTSATQVLAIKQIADNQVQLLVISSGPSLNISLVAFKQINDCTNFSF